MRSRLPTSLRFATAFLMAVAWTPVISAEITVRDNQYKTETGAQITISAIAISGPIASGDAAKFLSLTNSVRDAVVFLDSPGGTDADAIKIGDRVAIRQYSTFVADGMTCAPACGLIWIAGAEKTIRGTGRVGFYSAYSGETLQTGGPGNALVGAYYQRLGLSSAAIVFLTHAALTRIQWLDASTARIVGIDMNR